MSEELEKYACRQDELGQEVKKFEKNMRKDSSTRKTQQYIQSHQDKLEEYWAEIQEVHAKLIEVEDSTHPYFTQNYFDKLERQVQETQSYLNECRKQNSSKSSSNTKQEESETEQIQQAHRLKRQTVKINILLDTINQGQMEFLHQTTKIRYQNLKQRLQGQYKEITQLHEEILIYEVQNDGTYFTNETFKSTTTKYDAIIDRLDEAIENFASAPEATATNTIKLPQIRIPVFNGSYDNWTTFHDLFKKIVHTNRSLTNAEKNAIPQDAFRRRSKPNCSTFSHNWCQLQNSMGDPTEEVSEQPSNFDKTIRQNIRYSIIPSRIGREAKNLTRHSIRVFTSNTKPKYTDRYLGTND